MTNDRWSALPMPGGLVGRLAAPFGVLVLAGAVVSYVAAVDPNEHGNYPTCPFLALTGYQCPGCGSLRTIHALAHGQLGQAFGLNVFVVAMLPVLAFFWLRWTIARAADRPTRTKPGDPRLIWALFALIMVFWLVRNLPFGAFLAA
ncbi:membrane protein [Actinomadura rubrobrunea]|uniref:Membrane protein n=1 Tax=Actinomadura rubrobrunea TaxID=115335 RepID=A0A9W6PZR5_9ACTN|nr:DUF2752 domain-containing protein [Actinomadura rubrobrunea]GLW67215.1 membrane protein [Actinomadura rubrobrunea]